MEPIGTFQGLASGINFRDLVDQIIEVESRPITRIEDRLTELDRRTTAWGDFKNFVQTLADRAADLSDGELFRSFTTAVGVPAGSTAPVTVSAGTTASPGSFALKVNQLAARERLGSDVFADRTTALGYAGEFLVGGKAVSVSATDTLEDVATAINRVNSGTAGSGVTATIVGSDSEGYRLVLTADDTGAAGVALADGEGGVLQSLGFLDTSASIRNATSDGARSDAFLSSSQAVGALLGLTSPPTAAAVTIGGLSVTIDLSTDSLDDIASAINTAASAAGSSVNAAVVSETDDDGNTVKRLDINATTSFTDANGILETLGILQRGRADVQQQVQGAAFTDGDAVTAATGATLLTDLWSGGASAGVQAGDTLTLQGTRGDGTTFTKTFTVGAGSTYQDLVDALNASGDAFGAGTRTATASIAADGSLLVTDGTGGSSRLDLMIIANNEGGGTLDFGTFTTATVGREREITAGADAEFEVDGAFYTRSSNTVTDVAQGVTLNLVSATGETVLVDVNRDTDAIVSGITDFIKAYNSVAEFVNRQFNGEGAEEGELRQPLSGEGNLRELRRQLRTALTATISSVVTDVANLSALGIEMTREGTYDIDSGALKTAIENDPLSVERYFSVYGTGSTSSLEYFSAGDEAVSGTYDVVVTQAADRASVTGTGFAGTYVDDATADTLTLTDASTGSVYSISLGNGMTLTQIVDALNTELQTAQERQVQAANALYSDAVGTAATDQTLLQDLYDSGGTGLGIADGDVFTISGAKADGTSFYREFTVTDVTTQTLGDLRAEIAEAMGTEVVVSFESGVLTATNVRTGSSTMSLAVTSDNAGGGTFDLGGLTATVEGRAAAAIIASDSGGELKLEHQDYGTGEGFDVAYTPGGTDGSASLGLAAGSYRGIDVAGTIGGLSATGGGRFLEGDAGGATEGLKVLYTGTATGSVGSVTFSRGIASLMELATDAMLDGGDATIQGILDRIDTQKQGFNDRISRLEDRLDRRRESLIRRFTALEEAMAKAQQQMSWLQSQLAGLSRQG